MTLEEARNVLRVDEGDNDELIASLLLALPDYIEVTTGMALEQQVSEPLVKTVSKFILTLWYFADKADDAALNRTINNLLQAIAIKACRAKAASVASTAKTGRAKS